MTVRDPASMVNDPIWPEGLGLTLMVVTIASTIVATIVIGLRLYVRKKYGAYALDDTLMLAGWVFNIAHNAVVIVLTTYGMGAQDNELTIGMSMKVALWTIIWQFIYVLDGALIKSSIIVTMLRLANRKTYKILLWTLMGLTWATWQISWPVAIFQCKPVSAAWEGGGDCKSGQKVILQVSYFVSAVNIFTDLATALTPILLLRHLQMPANVKYLTMGILSLGVLASVATTIRITYTWAYTATHDQMYNIGKIVMLTVLECDLGIIAGSLPMLRRLFPSLNPREKSSKSSKGGSSAAARQKDVSLMTIGGGRRTNGYKLESSSNRDELDGPERHFQDTKNSDHDDQESTRRMIHVTREIEQSSITGDADGLERDPVEYPGGRSHHVGVGSRGNPQM